MLDSSTESGRKAEQRLREEEIIWLTTVRGDGQPQPVPVWFLWDGESFLIYSQPATHKLRNIRANRKVSLHLNSDDEGEGVIRIDGTAEIDRSAPPATQVAGMIEKYRDAIARLGTTPEEFARSYSVAVRVRPRVYHVW